MKFLIDAQLPPSLKGIFKRKGFDVVHTLDLPLQNDTQDEQINQLSIIEQRIVITKDKDFYDSFILRKVPFKLVLVKTGNVSTQDLKALFEKHFDELIEKLQNHSLVFLTKENILSDFV